MDPWLETRELPVHLVSAAGLVCKGGQVLLVRSARRGWELPGGILEQGEAVMDGLKREILEESGVIAEPVRLAGVFQNLQAKDGFGPLEGMQLPTTLTLVFRCRWAAGREKPGEGCEDAGWFSPEEARDMIRHPVMKMAFGAAASPEGRLAFTAFRQTEGSFEQAGSFLL